MSYYNGGELIMRIPLSGSGRTDIYEKLKQAAAAGKTLIKSNGTPAVFAVTSSYAKVASLNGSGAITVYTITSDGDISYVNSAEPAPTTSSGKWGFNSGVDLSSYDGSTDAKKYVTPSDGYVDVQAASGSTGFEKIHLHNEMGPSSTALCILRVKGDTTASDGAMFVKAGSVISHESGTNTGTWNVRFYGLK